MRRYVVGLVVATLVGLALSGPASAQGRRDLAALRQDVEELRSEIAELEQLAVQAPTAATAVQELSGRVSVIEQRLETLRRERAAIPDAIQVIDELTIRLDSVEEEVASLRTKLADLEQPWSPATSGGGGGVTHDGGFWLRTADDAYALRLYGYVQPRYQAVFADGDLESSGFRLRRARLGAKGHLGSERLTYKIMLELINAPPLLDYYGQYRVRDWLKVQVGQDKVPFTRRFLTSSSRISFVERPFPVEGFRYGRDTGLFVHGEVVDRLRYELSLTNGAGTNRGNDNLDLLATARLDAALVGERIGMTVGDPTHSDEVRVTVGVGAAHDLTPTPDTIGDVAVQDADVDDDGDVDNIRAVSASADLIARYLGFEVAAEAVWRSEDWGTILEANGDWAALVGDDGTRGHLGFFGHVNYFAIPEKLLVGARAGWADAPFLGLGGRSGADPGREAVLEADALAQYYLWGSRFLGLQYTLRDWDGRDGADDVTEHRVIVEAQLRI